MELMKVAHPAWRRSGVEAPIVASKYGKVKEHGVLCRNPGNVASQRDAFRRTIPETAFIRYSLAVVHARERAVFRHN